jgi:hypothetical protein
MRGRTKQRYSKKLFQVSVFLLHHYAEVVSGRGWGIFCRAGLLERLLKERGRGWVIHSCLTVGTDKNVCPTRFPVASFQSLIQGALNKTGIVITRFVFQKTELTDFPLTNVRRAVSFCAHRGRKDRRILSCRGFPWGRSSVWEKVPMGIGKVSRQEKFDSV